MVMGLSQKFADEVPTAFFHGRGPVWENGKAGRMDCLNLLLSELTDRGYAVQWRELSDDVERLAQANPRHLHVVLDDRPFAGENILFCIPSYLNGFWYLDRVGTRNNSSMRTRPFKPQGMGQTYAKEFVEKLRAKFVDTNRSKFDQEMVEGFTPEPGAICIFAQSFKAPRYHQHYMTYPELIDGVIANRGTRRVYIKPHPRQKIEDLTVLMRYHDPGAGVEVTAHSIHGLLAHAQCYPGSFDLLAVKRSWQDPPTDARWQLFRHRLVVGSSP